jgi:hypothetical protein
LYVFYPIGCILIINQQTFQGSLATRRHEEFENEDQEVSEMILLANSILSDFHRVAQISSLSLDVAILLHQHALNLLAEPHVQRSASLRGLGLAFAARFYWTGQLQDLHEAISLLRRAFASLPTSHSDRLALLHHLTAALLTRFGKMKDVLDLRDATSLYEAPEPGLFGSGSIMIAAEVSHEHQLDVSTTNRH